MEIVKGKYYRYKGENGFVVKASDDSTSEEFRGVVVLKGNYSWGVGNDSTDWSVSSFVESDLSEFLEEANKRYPMGSQYVCVGGDDLGKRGKGVAIVQYEARLWFYDGDLKGIEMGNFMVYNFKVNKWAEPFSNIDEEEQPIGEYESRISVFAENDLFNMETNEGRLEYAKKYYSIGTEFLNFKGKYRKVTGKPRVYNGTTIDVVAMNEDGEDNLYPDIYSEENGWCEIIKKEESKVMEIQRLSRQGLKEIHSVACASWQGKLHNVYGARNPLEDYIELSQDEVDEMFKACNSTQLVIVSKYLKQDDGSVDLRKYDSCHFINRRVGGEYENKAFILNESYDWNIVNDSYGIICLVPTKKK